MEKVIAVAIFLIGASCFAQSKHESVRRVVLPNPALLRCTSSACSGLWQGDPPDANAVHPRQVSIDLWGNSCPLGLTALYDKSVSVDELKPQSTSNMANGPWRGTQPRPSVSGAWSPKNLRFNWP